MSRFAKTQTGDLLELLRLAPRRRTNPFAVMEALVEALQRKVPPPELGAAVLAFDANLAAEARDTVERVLTPTARFFEATVPANVEGLRVETAWRAAAHALTKLERFEKRVPKASLATLKKLAVDDVMLEGAQVAVATADPQDVESNRWFWPLLVIDASPVSVDALMPHLDAALNESEAAREAFAPLAQLTTEAALVDVFALFSVGGSQRGARGNQPQVASHPRRRRR